MTINLNRRAVLTGSLGVALSMPFVSRLSAQERVTLRVANFSAPNSYIGTNVYRAWLDRVVADSEGTLDYRYFPGGVLGGNPTQQLKLVQDGVADMAFVIPSYISGSFNKWGALGIPGLAHTADEAAVALQRIYEEGLMEPVEGVELLAVYTTAIAHFHTSHPIRSLADIEGKRITGTSPAQYAALTRLGAVPEGNVRANEAAEAMSRGTVDGVLMDYMATQSFRVDDVATAHANLPMGLSALWYPINAATWASLAEPAKEAFRTHSGEAFTQFAVEVMRAGADANEAVLAARPNESFLDITPEVQEEFAAKIAGIEDEWIGGDSERQAVYDRFVAVIADIRAGN